MVQPVWKTVWQFLRKLNIQSPYDPTIPRKVIDPTELKTQVRIIFYKNVHSSIIHSSQKVGTTQTSISWQMGKQNMANPHNGILSESNSVLSNDSLRLHGLYSPWNSPGQNPGMGSLFLLQRIFPTQGSNPGLLQCRRILYQMRFKGSQDQRND